MSIRKGDPRSRFGGRDGRDPARSDIVLGGRYRLLSLLGEGGVASVWQCRDMRTGVLRAVKLLPPSHVGSGHRAQRLLREGRVMMRLRHPNIVSVYDVGESPEGPWYAMELVPGGTLEHRVRRDGRLSARQAVAFTLDTLDGLIAAHAVGVIHRDIKPSNLLIDENNRIIVADFGIALVNDSHTRDTRTGAMLGSMLFMAPEQRIDARSVGPTADIYALGATLFYALTGETPVDLFLTQPTSPRWRSVPAALRPILQRAVALDPDDRFPSATALSTVLRDALPFLTSHDEDEDLSVETRPPESGPTRTMPDGELEPLPPQISPPPRSFREAIVMAATAATIIPEPLAPTVAHDASGEATRVLVVDDDPMQRGLLATWLRGENYVVTVAGDGDEGVEAAARIEPDVVVLDLFMIRVDGFEAMSALRALPRPPIVVVLTGAGDVATAVRAMRSGADDFMAKPVGRADLLGRIRGLVASRGAAPEPIVPERTFAGLGAVSTQMGTVFAALDRLARRSTPVLILGPEGTGKSTLARAVHTRSPRRNAALAIVQGSTAGAEPDGGLGAIEDAWARARGGTIVVDDVDHLGVRAVRQLVRLLDVRPLVRDDDTEIDDFVRVVATSTGEPPMVWPGGAGADLLGRFAGGRVDLPPLVERDGDVGHLTRSLMKSTATRIGRVVPRLDERAARAWRAYEWPRNVKELEETIGRVVAVAGPSITLEDLPPAVRGSLDGSTGAGDLARRG